MKDDKEVVVVTEEDTEDRKGWKQMKKIHQALDISIYQAILVGRMNLL